MAAEPVVALDGLRVTVDGEKVWAVRITRVREATVCVAAASRAEAEEAGLGWVEDEAFEQVEQSADALTVLAPHPVVVEALGGQPHDLVVFVAASGKEWTITLPERAS